MTSRSMRVRFNIIIPPHLIESASHGPAGHGSPNTGQNNTCIIREIGGFDRWISSIGPGRACLDIGSEAVKRLAAERVISRNLCYINEI